MAALLPRPSGLGVSSGRRHAAIATPLTGRCAVASVGHQRRDSANVALQPKQPCAGHGQSVAHPSHPRRTTCCVSIGLDAGSKDSSWAGLSETLTLLGLFLCWYISNVVFNIYNKQALLAFPHPLTMTTLQLMVGSLLAIGMWATGAVRRPQLTPALLKGMLPLAAIHCMGNLLTNMSLGSVAVSFTHTIKAMEPFFTVMLSAVFLGEQPTLPVLLTLLPIVGGVVVASLTEISFNWMGFLTAMGSNLTFQSRNVLSKRLMLTPKALDQDLDNISMFSIITVISLLLLLPFQLALEGWVYAPGALVAAGIACPGIFWQQVLCASLCRSADQQVSYAILRLVSPVTHSIGNCVKRVVVIVGALLFFGNAITLQNACGTGMALVGVFAYTQVKRMQREAASEAPIVEFTEADLKGDAQRRLRPDQTMDELPG